MRKQRPSNLFPLGTMVATPGALEAMRESDEMPLTFLARHASGDWGDLDSHDKRANNSALVSGTRIFSAYRTANGERLWVITEADRSSTCILLPDEY